MSRLVDTESRVLLLHVSDTPTVWLRDDKIASSEHTSATNDWLTMSLSACNNISFLKTRTLCLKTTLMQHTIITKIGWYALMLLRECAIKWWFVIPLLLTNVSALPKETPYTKPQKLCLFNHAVCRVSKATLRLLLQKFPKHVADFVFFSDENGFTVASPVNLQNDRVYTLIVQEH